MLELDSKQHRIFIVGNGSLFDEGLAKLVRFSTTLQVSHIVYSNEVALLDRIKHDQPEMLLLSESNTLATEQLLNLLSINTLVIGLCIFVVRLSNFTVDTYEFPGAMVERQPLQRRTITVRTGNDLIDVLKGTIR